MIERKRIYKSSNNHYGCGPVKVLRPDGSIKKVIQISDIHHESKKSKTKRIKLINNSRIGNKYHTWRSNVLIRDHYKCVLCDDNHKIEAHHIDRWVDNTPDRFNINNGVALCHECHQKYHNYRMEKFPHSVTNILKRYIELKNAVIKIRKRDGKVAEKVVAC
jgi:hypothetical protein